MKTSTKLAIAGAVVLVLGGGGIALAASLKKKDDAIPGTGGEANTLDNTQTTGGSSTQQTSSSSNSGSNTSTSSSGNGSAYTPPTTYTPPTSSTTNTNSSPATVEPTPEEYIQMADRWMTWENIWKFAKALGINDKDQVGGTSTAYSDAIISNASRKKFGEISIKYANMSNRLFVKKQIHRILTWFFS